MEAGICLCLEGVVVTGFCTNVSGCVKTAYISNSTVCQECDQLYFHQTPVSGICECLSPTASLINGICNNITGCVSPTIGSNGSILCLSCNLAAGFQSQPVDGLCSCIQYYELSGSSCREVCGDGVLFSSNSSLCDDGNNEDGDGCSSSC